MITRFVILPDSRRVILGLDKANLFEEGQVYQATEMLGEIILRKLGPMAMTNQGYPNTNNTLNEQVQGAAHLMTKAEWDSLIEAPHPVG